MGLSGSQSLPQYGNQATLGSCCSGSAANSCVSFRIPLRNPLLGNKLPGGAELALCPVWRLHELLWQSRPEAQNGWERTRGGVTAVQVQDEGPRGVFWTQTGVREGQQYPPRSPRGLWWGEPPSPRGGSAGSAGTQGPAVVSVASTPVTLHRGSLLWLQGVPHWQEPQPGSRCPSGQGAPREEV